MGFEHTTLLGWLAASWYAFMWQHDAVGEFMCASHYLAVLPHDAVPVETHKLTLAQ